MDSSRGFFSTDDPSVEYSKLQYLWYDINAIDNTNCMLKISGVTAQDYPPPPPPVPPPSSPPPQANSPLPEAL